jgi:hypothetical protein
VPHVKGYVVVTFAITDGNVATCERPTGSVFPLLGDAPPGQQRKQLRVSYA